MPCRTFLHDRSLSVPIFRVLCCQECSRDLKSCMCFLLGLNLICLRLDSPMPDLWTDTTCFQVSGDIHDWTFSNYTRHLLKSLGLLFVSFHICKAYSAPVHELYITVPTPCEGSNLRLSSSSLNKVITHSGLSLSEKLSKAGSTASRCGSYTVIPKQRSM